MESEGMDYNQDGERVSRLEKEVHGLHNVIGKVEANQEAQQRAIENIGSNVEKLIDQRTTMTPSLVFGGVAMVCAFFFGIAEYNSQQNEPQDLMIELMHNSIATIQEDLVHKDDLYEQWRAESHYEVAKNHAFHEIMERLRNEDLEYKRHHDEQFHGLDGRVRDLEQNERSNQTALRAMGDYLQEHTSRPNHNSTQ